MFGDSNFNQPLNDWNVSNVKDMGGMFWDAKLFNQDIGGWDVSNVEDMRNMFKDSGMNELPEWCLHRSYDSDDESDHDTDNDYD